MTLDALNALPKSDAEQAFLRCCGSSEWARQMAQKRPFQSRSDLLESADSIWWNLDDDHWHEAFGAHPKIGDIDSLRKKYANTKDWSEGEQRGVESASEKVLKRLAKANDKYEAKFGYIFIVCATGKTASQMLDILEQRLPNDRDEELKIAAKEQAKITRLRLNKLLTAQGETMSSPITTHVLDTANGHPAKGITVVLERQSDNGQWRELTRGETNDDGRISDWLPGDEPAQPGVYRATFEVAEYFDNRDQPFYSSIPIIFHLNDPDAHYHVPLLLSPYGYTTYRGS